MNTSRMLTDEQWERIAEIIAPSNMPGTKIKNPRVSFEGILRHYRDGATWSELGEEHGNSSTLWRRHQSLSANGRLAAAFHALTDVDDLEPNLEWLLPIAAKYAKEDPFAGL